MWLHRSVSGAYLNSGLRIELAPKKCFVSKGLGLRLLLVLLRCRQRERAGVLGLWMSPGEAHGCNSLLGFHCGPGVGLGLLRCGVAFLATVSLLLWCWVHLSPTFANPTRMPWVISLHLRDFFNSSFWEQQSRDE